MSEFNFVPGEYRTKDGRRAFVWFRVQEPCESMYKLVGEIQSFAGNWDRSAWADDGMFSRFSSCDKSDLVAPVRYCYKNCYEHDCGGRYETDPSEYSDQAPRLGVLRMELTRQGAPNWRTVEFIPPENLERA
jgi:hypothetical protein